MRREPLVVRIRRLLKSGMWGLTLSLLAHVALLLVMALFIVRHQSLAPPEIELDWAVTVDREETPPDEPEKPVVLPSISMSPSTPAPRPVQQPESASSAPPPRPEEPEPLEVRPVDVSEALTLRSLENRPAVESAGEADLKVRESLENGFRWLLRQQEPSGAWSLRGPYSDGGSIETRTGATCLALLAFLGDGQTHQSGGYQQEIQAALDWLVSQQRADGDLFDIDEQGMEAHFYSHAQGTIALCEALALTGDEALRAPAEKALAFLVAAQNPELGGWKYRPLSASGIGDLSVTGWALMGLHSGRMIGVEPEFETYLIASRFLDSVQERAGDGSRYKYRPDFPPEESQRWSMTAEGLLCRQWLGWPRNAVEMRRGVDFLLSPINLPEWKAGRRNVYAWYYTAQTLHNLGGEAWLSWYARVRDLIVDNQQRGGSDRGSWHPARPAGAFQERSRDAGRLYLTAMCLLILETPYRHAPLYPEPTPEPGERLTVPE